MGKLTDYRFKKVRKIMHGEEIYNIDKELKKELIKQFADELVNQLKDNSAEIKITDRELLLAYLPQLTSIEFDTEDELEIMSILENPDTRLEEIMEEVIGMITPVIYKAGKLVQDNLQFLQKQTEGMTEEEIKAYIDAYVQKANEVADNENNEEIIDIEEVKEPKQEQTKSNEEMLSEFEQFMAWKKAQKGE